MERHVTHYHTKNLSFINFEDNSCALCKSTFDDLDLHIKEKHGLDPKTGRDLSRPPPKRKSISPGRDTGDADDYCDICCKRFSNINNLHTHAKSVHGDNDPKVATFTCPDCNGRFVNEKRYARHLAVIHDKPQYFDGSVCLVCNSEFSRQTVRLHIKSVHKINPYTGEDISDKFFCNYCQKIVGNMHKHTKGVHQKIFTCETCKAPFTIERTLHNHRLELHDIPLPATVISSTTVTCQFCEVKFSSASAHWVHFNNIHGKHNPDVAKYKCDQCPALFVTEEQQMRHIKWHTGKTAYKVPAETKNTSIETSEICDKSQYICGKKYFCACCRRQFSASTNFHIHIRRVHGNGNPNVATFPCDGCAAAFVKEGRV